MIEISYRKKSTEWGKNEAGNMEKNKSLICIRIFSEILDAKISDAMPLHSKGKNVEIRNPYT